MKHIMTGLIVLMMANPVFAASKPGFFDTLLKGLKSKIGNKLESKNRLSSVAAVRGERIGQDPWEIYWKGGVSEGALKKQGEEKKELADAVQLVVDGKTTEGKAALLKFKKDHPNSGNMQDVDEALKNLPQEDTAAPAVNAGPAAGDDEKSAAPAAKKPAKPADDEDEE